MLRRITYWGLREGKFARIANREKNRLRQASQAKLQSFRIATDKHFVSLSQEIINIPWYLRRIFDAKQK